ncbi:MAG TPA: hypothetical protein VFH80_15380 [Solirubrobacteraceae bacterium]|nr:hypothetical protein [Solirubrobacteraceae bacterium]
MPKAADSFDPRTIIATLERNYVDYVLIGGLAQVLRGADVVTSGVDICPSFAGDNLARVTAACRELEARARDGHPLTFDEASLMAAPVVKMSTTAGQLNVVGSPAGVPGGYVALRRSATREDLGHGVRPLVAATGDLATMAAALHREQDRARLPMLRRIVELEVERAPAVAQTPATRSRPQSRSTTRASRVRS